jgi:hypothetical protein
VRGDGQQPERRRAVDHVPAVQRPPAQCGKAASPNFTLQISMKPMFILVCLLPIVTARNLQWFLLPQLQAQRKHAQDMDGELDWMVRLLSHLAAVRVRLFKLTLPK